MRKFVLAAVVATSALGLVACAETAEDAGEKVDAMTAEAAETGEKAVEAGGEAVDKAGEKANDLLEKAIEKGEEAIDKKIDGSL